MLRKKEKIKKNKHKILGNVAYRALRGRGAWICLVLTLRGVSDFRMTSGHTCHLHSQAAVLKEVLQCIPKEVLRRMPAFDSSD
jgi:hypothetical protein